MFMLLITPVASPLWVSGMPSALAQATASVMELMGNRRFNLGLGTSGKCGW